MSNPHKEFIEKVFKFSDEAENSDTISFRIREDSQNLLLVREEFYNQVIDALASWQQEAARLEKEVYRPPLH